MGYIETLKGTWPEKVNRGGSGGGIDTTGYLIWAVTEAPGSDDRHDVWVSVLDVGPLPPLTSLRRTR